MGKYNNFIKPTINEDNYEVVSGEYGCQNCDEYLSKAYFDKYIGIMFWICSKNHRSEIKIGV